MNDYPFVKCLHPRKIRNPYNHETIVVPCGHCEVCQTKKSSIRSLKCQLEDMAHNYCMFVTLTYSDKYVPRMIALPFGKNLQYTLVSTMDHSSGHILGSVPQSENFDVLFKKTNLGRFLPYLDKKDLQLFLKRFRKNLSKYSDEKIRYFACGEYGPVHFRPHFHILFWFSSKKTLSSFRQTLYKSWTFGRVDASVSRGSCASYVAGYLNGSCNLPKIYRLKSTQPFTTHSFFLGEKVLRSDKQEIYKMQPSDFAKRSLSINGSSADIFMWRSLTSYYFPRCQGYSQKSGHFRKLSYTMYATLSKFTGETKPIQVAKKTLEYILQYGLYCHDSSVTEILISLLDDSQIIDYYDCQYDMILRYFYTQIRLSYHFLTFCCDNQSYHEISCKLSIIDNYYKSIEYDNLKNQMDIQDTLLQDSYNSEYVRYLYDNLSYNFDSLEDSKIFKQFREISLKHYSDSFKHKMLNDKNHIFENI